MSKNNRAIISIFNPRGEEVRRWAIDVDSVECVALDPAGMWDTNALEKFTPPVPAQVTIRGRTLVECAASGPDRVPQRGDVYCHWKGTYYEVVGVARSADNTCSMRDVTMVVYRRAGDTAAPLYTRELKEWQSSVDDPRTHVRQPRFVFIKSL